MSARCLERARAYTADVLAPQRTGFHEAVRSATLEAQQGLRG
jgi:hypothetical protein